MATAAISDSHARVVNRPGFLGARVVCLLVALAATAVCGRSGAQTDWLSDGFQDPPLSSRLRMFWRVFGPAWTRPEIDRQLTELKRVGVGGVMTCFTYPVALDEPASGFVNQRYLSPEFLDTLGYARSRADTLGLAFGVAGGTGWPFGGPTVTREDAAKRIRLERAVALTDGSGWRLPRLREGERYLAAFHGAPVTEPPHRQTAWTPSREDWTSRIVGDRIPNGPATAPASPAEPTPIVFIVGPTRMLVKRPAFGGEGYVLDHYSRSATLHYLDSAVGPLVQAAPRSASAAAGVHGSSDGAHFEPLTLFCDSLEVYGANWTDSMAADFRARRGYDLVPFLPDLFDDASPLAPGLRFDFWRTLADLCEANFVRPTFDWCHARGIRFAVEPYGTPPLGLTAASYSDVPWGEQYEYRGFSFSRYAASAGHLAGKRIIGAEAWTWTGMPNRLADSLADLKLCSDLHFLAGENELTGVDYPYSPAAAPPPGWMPYYGPVLNEQNPQWALFPELAAYAGRCQWMLRQGRPIADVALYLPTEDCFAEGPVGQMLLDFKLRDRLAVVKTDEFGLDKAMRHRSETVVGIQRAGLNFDGIDFFALTRRARVEGGALAAGDGRYRVVVLPGLQSIELSALDRLAEFCRAGGTVIATGRLPERTAGRHDESIDARLRERIASIFGLDPRRAQEWLAKQATGFGAEPASTPLQPAHRHRFGSGVALFTGSSSAALCEALRTVTPPDIETMNSGRAAERSAPNHVHRSLGRREIYFVSPIREVGTDLRGTLRGVGRLTFWNPMTGAVTPVPSHSTGGRTEFLLSPFVSGFLCLDRGKPPAGPALTTTSSRGTERRIELTGEWSVAFRGAGSPPAVAARRLVSWTDWPGARFFSGCGIYETSLQADREMCRSCRLCFHEIHEAAELFVNGRRAGGLWTPPFAIDISRYLVPGRNRLQVRVYNLPLNRVLGLPDPDLSALRAAYGNRFPDPEEKKIVRGEAPSGIVGPVWIVTRRANPSGPPAAGR